MPARDIPRILSLWPAFEVQRYTQQLIHQLVGIDDESKRVLLSLVVSDQNAIEVLPSVVRTFLYLAYPGLVGYEEVLMFLLQ